MFYFIWFWRKIVGRAFYIFFQRKKETKRAYALLEKIECEFDGKFIALTRRKIAVSYGIYLPMVCEAFSRLYGRSTSKAEKKRFSYYFICSSLFDDFIDNHLISEETLYHISFQHKNYVPKTFNEKVFLFAHQYLRSFVTDKKNYDRVSQALYDAQMESKNQYKGKLSQDQIKGITSKKGGYAVLLCSFYMDHQSGTMEQSCWYQLGVLIQLTNDLYDIYKDLQDNIATLPNTIQDIHTFEHFFYEKIKAMKKNIAQLPFSSRRKKEFNLSMAGIYAFGSLAIHQLKNLQGNSTTLPRLKSLTRKQLIIDMEKIGNLILWFKFVYRYARSKEPDRLF